MKFSFEERELHYLNTRMQQLAAASHKAEDAVLMRMVTKMRYKFTPNASKVFLGQNEKQLLVSMASYRLANMSDMEVLSEEYELLKTIKSKLEEKRK